MLTSDPNTAQSNKQDWVGAKTQVLDIITSIISCLNESSCQTPQDLRELLVISVECDF